MQLIETANVNLKKKHNTRWIGNCKVEIPLSGGFLTVWKPLT